LERIWRARGDLNPGLLHWHAVHYGPVLQLYPVFLRGFGVELRSRRILPLYPT